MDDLCPADAELDGIAVCLIYTRLATLLKSRQTADFTANSYSFNAAFVKDGVMVHHGSNIVASDIRIWGTEESPPSGKEKWKPQHVQLDRWRGGVYAACREVGVSGFLSSEWHGLNSRVRKAFGGSLRNIAIYVRYRVARWKGQYDMGRDMVIGVLSIVAVCVVGAGVLVCGW